MTTYNQPGKPQDPYKKQTGFTQGTGTKTAGTGTGTDKSGGYKNPQDKDKNRKF